MYYNLNKASEILGMSTADVNRLREKGKLRAFRDGSDWKFRKEDVDKFLANMIKEGGAANPLAADAENDIFEEQTISADDQAFDSMYDNVSLARPNDLADADPFTTDDDALKIPDEPDDDLVLANDQDELVEAPAETDPVDDLIIAPEDNLALPAEAAAGTYDLQGESPLTSEDSALAEDPVSSLIADTSGHASSVDLAELDPTGDGSGDVLNLNSDSGLNLIDDLGGGSNVDLGDDGNIVLGGSGSGSGSGDGLKLDSDSGLGLAADSDAQFELDAAIKETSPAHASADDLALDPLLAFTEDADDAPTELGGDDSVFALATDVQAKKGEDSESVSKDLFTTEEAEENAERQEEQDIFYSKDDDEDQTLVDPDAGGEEPTFPLESVEPSNDLDSVSGFIETDEGTLSQSQSDLPPFGETTPDAFANPTDAFGAVDAFGAATSASPQIEFPTDDARPLPRQASSSSSMEFTGKDLFFLVPCLLFLILATIGAIELCRTIWGYQEGGIEIGGPLLESIAKMVKLI